MLLLGDIVFTLRLGHSLGMCWRLWFLSNGSKWKVPKAKSLPIKSLECYDTMQISPNLRRNKEKLIINLWVAMDFTCLPWVLFVFFLSHVRKQYFSFQTSSEHTILHIFPDSYLYEK
jgi:hypothetical protein